MYTLTEVSVENENVTFHQKLGERFSIIEREISQGEFERAYNSYYRSPENNLFKEKDINKDIYCIVVSEGGKGVFTLSKKNFYYIVTENGKTFKNLTFK